MLQDDKKFGFGYQWTLYLLLGFYQISGLSLKNNIGNCNLSALVGVETSTEAFLFIQKQVLRAFPACWGVSSTQKIEAGEIRRQNKGWVVTMLQETYLVLSKDGEKKVGATSSRATTPDLHVKM